jgi:hypothetical protein
MNKYNNSSYWLQDWDDDDILVDSMNDVEKKSHDLYKLASAKKAIANFVNIVTNDNINVKFNTRGNSYTDGKTVVIGANIVEPKDFDVAVGLALHEGSHIKLSDFELLSDIYNLVPQHIKDGAIKKGVLDSISIIKDLWNYVEDRRIDQYVFNQAPGYRDYYRKMYDKYFNDKLIDKALLSDEHTDETIESYMFRIINLHNKNTNLSKLKGLKEIYKTVDLKNILRLSGSTHSFEVALELFKIILSNISNIIDNPSKQTTSDESDTDNGSSGDGSSDEGMSDEDFNDLLESIGESPIGGGTDDTPTGGNSMSVDNVPDGMSGEETKDDSKSTSSVQLTDRQKDLLKKKIEKQKKFMDGEISKKTVSKKNQETIEAIQESGSEVTHVAQNYEGGWGQYSKGTECIVVKKLTQSLFENEAFPMTSTEWRTNTIRLFYQESVNKGIKLGTMLGKKLQVRGEDRTTVFNRQKIGKIDKRMISSLGFGNQNVFQFTELDSYKNANLHVSIDASGSMGGDKWDKTMINVVALCKAVDMIQNLSIQVTFRTTSNNLPYIVMAYDSRVDKFSKVKKMFGGLGPGGTTPEGLCFEAIMKHFLPSNTDMDSYFLNLSDGEPYFHGQNFYYSGKEAATHTRKMVKMLEGMGIKTLSYFIKGHYDGGSDLFKTMYGNGAQDIDVTNANQISKTMNKLFLAK